MGISTTRSRTDETQRLQVWGTVDVGTIPQSARGRVARWRPSEIVACFSRYRVDGGGWSTWEVESLSWSGMTAPVAAAAVPRSERIHLADLGAAEPDFVSVWHEVRRWVRAVTPDGELQQPFRPVAVG